VWGENFEKYVAKNDVKEVILAIQKISPVHKRKIVDKCIAVGVEIKIVPPAQNWVKGELKTSQIKVVKIDELLGRDVINLDNKLLQYKLQDKVVLVTGAAGRIGSEIVKQLIY
jgi:FlaA1/EpsC-like NDP-sugar epimerase